MSELCKSQHFLPEQPPFYESSLKKTEFLEDVESQEYNFTWRVMVRFLCKPIVFLTLPLKTRDSLVPVVSTVRQRAGAHEALDHSLSALYTSRSVLFPLCFPKKKRRRQKREKTNKQTKHKSKHTNKSTTTNKNLITGPCGIRLYQFGLEKL